MSKIVYYPLGYITWDNLCGESTQTPIVITNDNSIGFIPVYENAEDAVKEYPDCEIRHFFYE